MSDAPGPLRVDPAALIAGVVRALQEQVLPQVASKTARGQVWAAIDVLRNLGGRIEAAHAPLEAEARSIEAALRAVADAAQTSAAPLANAIGAELAAVPAAPIGERVVALRARLCDTFQRLDALPAEIGDALRAPLGAHLAAQVVRDLAGFQGSLLDEISKG